MKKIIYFLILIVLISSNAYSANWYVDKEAVGANNGASWTNAWSSFSRIIWGSNGIKAGDTLYISGGSTSKIYTERWAVGVDGSSGNPVTIKVGQDNGHNGTVIFDYDSLGDRATENGITVGNRSYIVIDGSVSGVSKMLFKNLRNIDSATSAVAISGPDAKNITVKYVNVDNCNNGFRFTMGTGYTVHNCKLTNIRGDGAISFLGSTGTWDSNKVYNCYIGLSWNNGGPDGIQNGHGLSAYNNTFRVDKVSYPTSNQHPDYFQSVGNYIKVYNNDFINVGDSCFDSDASYFNFTPHDILIYNNTFRILETIDIYPEFIRFYNCSQSITNVKVFNNTFIDASPATPVVYFNCGSGCTGSGIEVKNNIFKNVTTAFSNSSSFSVEMDYNIYSGVTNILRSGTYYSPTTWIASNEPNSNTLSPTFTAYKAFDINNDLGLSASDTAAKDKGTSLSSYFTTDKNGKARTGTWDIGAFEGEGSGMRVPINLKIIPTP